MKLISPIRTLRVLLRAPHLFAWLTDGPFSFPLSNHTLRCTFYQQSSLTRMPFIPWAPQHSPGHTFTLFLPTIELT